MEMRQAHESGGERGETCIIEQELNEWEAEYRNALLRGDLAGAKDFLSERSLRSCSLEELLFTKSAEDIERLCCLVGIRAEVRRVLCEHNAALVLVLDIFACLLVLTLYLTVGWQLQHNGPLTQTDKTLLAVLFVANSYVLFRELLQARTLAEEAEAKHTRAAKGLKESYLNLRNAVDWSSIVAVYLLVAVGSLAGDSNDNYGRTSDAYRCTAAVGAILVWSRTTFQGALLQQDFAVFLSAVMRIVSQELIPFMVFLMLFVAQWASFFIFTLWPRVTPEAESHGNDDGEAPFMTFSEALMSCFRMLVGDFDRDWFRDPSNPFREDLATLGFVAFVFFGTVILFNVLVAVISDTYEDVRLKSTNLYHLVRFLLAVELKLVAKAMFGCCSPARQDSCGAERAAAHDDEGAVALFFRRTFLARLGGGSKPCTAALALLLLPVAAVEFVACRYSVSNRSVDLKADQGRFQESSKRSETQESLAEVRQQLRVLLEAMCVHGGSMDSVEPEHVATYATRAEDEGKA